MIARGPVIRWAIRRPQCGLIDGDDLDGARGIVVAIVVAIVFWLLLAGLGYFIVTAAGN
jgi:hypothetical protein